MPIRRENWDDATRIQCPRCGSAVLAATPDGRCPTCHSPLDLSSSRGSPDGSVTVSAPRQGVIHPLSSAPQLRPDEEFGDYRITRLLGRGGMGEVYAAEHIEHGLRVALKVLNHQIDDPLARARFRREGQLAAALSHPHVVYVYGSEYINTTPVIIMELVTGGTLNDAVEAKGSAARARSR